MNGIFIDRLGAANLVEMPNVAVRMEAGKQGIWSVAMLVTLGAPCEST